MVNKTNLQIRKHIDNLKKISLIKINYQSKDHSRKDLSYNLRISNYI